MSPQLPNSDTSVASQAIRPTENASNLTHTNSSPLGSQTAKPPSTHQEISYTPHLPSLQQKALLRILDANLDRAREGIRTIEEWCRFGLNDADAISELKDLRQRVAHWHTDDIRAARDTPGDAGKAITHPQEAHKSSLANVLQSNLARTQEAFRVLEEYGKLYHPNLAADSKQMRYRMYTLDSQLMSALTADAGVSPERARKLAQARTYLVTSPVPNLLETVEAALKGGIAIVQYREKTANDEDRLAIARQLCELCHRYQALFIVNDRVDIAAASGADGVHLGQQDVPMEVARQLMPAGTIVGRSTTNPQELQRAIDEKADYVGVGPIHTTPTKPGKAAAGDEYVRYAASHAPMPWFAIGGLNSENLTPTLAAGATRIAVVRALMAAENPTEVAHSLVKQVKQTQHSN